MMSAIEERYLACIACGSLPWKRLALGINACVEAVGGTRQLARLAHVPNVLFCPWRHSKRTPSLTYVLEVGYVLDLSPLQLMTVEPERLKTALRTQKIYRLPPCFKRPAPPSKGDVAGMQAFLHTVLDGLMGPLPVRHVARHLGVGEKFLVRRFPQACARITAQYQGHRAAQAKQRVERECAEVRQVVVALYEQEGMVPGVAQVVAQLSNPNLLRRPEAKATWRSLRRELLIEQEERGDERGYDSR